MLPAHPQYVLKRFLSNVSYFIFIPENSTKPEAIFFLNILGEILEIFMSDEEEALKKNIII